MSNKREKICLKIWFKRNEQVCNPKLVTRQLDWLLEGLEFNRRFAPGVYLGIAPIEISDYPRILRGKLIEKPKSSDIKSEVDYALVMKCLDESWRLDYRMYHEERSKTADLKFLGRAVAQMHKKLVGSPVDNGTPAFLRSKLEINRQLFEECLEQFKNGLDIMDKYLWISNLMLQAHEYCTRLFEQRYENHCIKRCHGDLKATNLWLCPKKTSLGLKTDNEELIALDCIDFNPDFCHIDTLSDVAMLAIDLEMHLTNWLKVDANRQEGERLVHYFLDSYLTEMQEDSDAVKPLLEYYMTEKAMVCTYVSILYDDRPVIGAQYLQVALVHMLKLEEMLMYQENSSALEQEVNSELVAHSR